MSDIPNLSEHLIAGRRAAYTEVLIAARQMANATQTGDTDEQYAGGHILIDGLDIGPAVDAAVLETLVRLEPELQNSRDWQAALRMKPAPWDRFWRAYAGAMLDGRSWALWLVVGFIGAWVLK